TIEYKFINGNSWDDPADYVDDLSCGRAGQYGNRWYIVPNTSAVMAPVCMNSCESCEEETPDQTSGTIFFSEYGEGSSQNKYLEIYNGTDNAADLNQFAFPNVANDPDTPGEYEYWNTFPDGATVAPGEVYVIAHPEANADILAEADHTFTYLSNGNDGYCIAEGTEGSYTIVDCIGDWNGNPGNGWDVAGVTEATKDHTLIRKPDVTSGNGGNWDISAGTNEDNSEWVVLNNDNWTNLGSHIEANDLDDDGILYVPGEYATIQEAIDAAWFGQTVQVAAGTYVENINFNGKNISVIGVDQATTIIDGDSSEAVVMFRNGETRSALLQNFTITNGNASNSSVSYGDGGGGVHIRYSSPTLKDLIVTSNYASDYGGGVAIYGDSNPLLDNIAISENSASRGGGLCVFKHANVVIQNTIISNNIT
ncbi:MAG TPA: hypothetical protein QF698_04140, partial [Candidatus Marinimicrobia bacterium]|nr:hypothetical protein [Candidatus Neomarinimicrobiota bacterium]